ncbi:Cysteine and glycine-rich protein 3 [Rhizoctonia solani]|uniref:Cysteine and glycine-rich protein 3 n=1 Tax=Rhizoctonia solani TaxID=456999 RepID=A0A0K6FZ36_9AGAM|nr:Cysteine and glycine-rich protein 3 [Rhizoctonia solani]
MNMFGGPSKCPRCEKTVYAAEQIIGPGRQIYHKFCLKCTSCNKRLDSYSLVEHNQQPYCKPCHVRGFGTRDLRHQNLPQTSPPASPSSRNAQPASPPASIDGLAGRFSKDSAPKLQNEPPLTPPRTVSPATETAESENLDIENVESIEPQPQSAALDSYEAPAMDTAESTKEEPEDGFTAPSPPLSASPTRAPALPPRTAPLRNTYNFEYRQKSGTGSRFPAPLSPSAIKKGSTGFAALRAGPPSPTRRTAFGAEPAQSPLTPSATGSMPIRSIVSTPTGTIRQVPPIVTMQSSLSLPARPLIQTPTGMRSTTAGGGSPNIFGGRVECPRCAKAVYHAEQVTGPGGRKYHKPCLRCVQCNSSLNAGKFTEKDGEPMCRNCYSKTYGPQGSGYALIGRAG